MKLINAAACLVAAMLLLLPGCSDDTGDAGPALPASQEEASAPGGLSPEALKTEKWNGYVDFSNKFTPYCLQYLASYFDNFNEPEFAAPEGEFSFKQGNLPAPDMAFAAGIDAVLALTGDGERQDLDAVAADYGAALKALWEPLAAAYGYYQDKAYLNDNFARGRELHGQILAAYDNFEPLDLAFEHAMDAADHRMLAEGIAALQAKGLKVQPAMLEMIMAAQKAQDALGRRSAEAPEAPGPFADFVPLHEAMREKLEALEGLAQDEEQMIREGMDPEKTREVIRYAHEAEDIAARLAAGPDNQPPHGGDAAALPEFFFMRLQKMVDVYNSMVR